MITELPTYPTPQWIIDIVETPEEATFCLNNIVANSLYYPASGYNGTPIKFLSGNIHSYVYADYGITKNELLINLDNTGNRLVFKHYHKVIEQEVTQNAILPDNWIPAIPFKNPANHRRYKRPTQFFGQWSIWQRNEDSNPAVGPRAFSLLFLIAEMSDVFQGLYNRLLVSPKILAIIQPGAFGGEWECVTSNDSFFKKVVTSNPAGLPHYLLCGGFGSPTFYEEPCWTDYRGIRLAKLPERYAGLWLLNST